TVPSRGIFVEVEATPNPDSLKFVPNEPLMEEARSSKLVRELLRIPHVSSVFVSPTFLSVNKSEAVPWDAVRALVLHHMLEHFESGEPLLTELPAPDAAHMANEEDDEVVAAIKELMETRLRPAVQEDGGDIFLHSWDAVTGTVTVRMAGSCVGCPSSTVTLRNGVETMLKHYVPEVQAIEAVEGAAEGAPPPPPTLEERLEAAGVPSGPVR
ncbi:NIFU5, partial [Symbiodinium sp. KB8]